MEESSVTTYVIDSGKCYPTFKKLAIKVGCPSSASSNDDEWQIRRRNLLKEVEKEKIPVRVILKTRHIDSHSVKIYLIQDTKYDEYFLIGESGLKLYSNQIDALPEK